MFSKAFSPIATAAAAAVLALCAVSAQAASLTVTGFTFGSQDATIDRSYAGPLHVDAGAVNAVFSGFGTASFMTYCVDVYQSVALNTTYNDFTLVSGVQQFGATKANDVGRLITSFGSQVNTARESAAMQLAVWEIMDETSGTYNVSRGTFSAAMDNWWDAGTISLANTYLSTMGTNNIYTVSALHSDTRQDFLALAVAPVPEPSTYALMLGGLMGVGFIARRRKDRIGR